MSGYARFVAATALVFGLTGGLAAPSGAEPAASPRVVSIVKVKTPWYAPRFFVRWRFEAAAPRYAEIPGLERKFFTIADSGELGGIYLWRDRAAADAFYDAAWHADIAARYGEPASLEIEESGDQVSGQSRTDVPAAVRTDTTFVAVVMRSAAVTPAVDTPGLVHLYGWGRPGAGGSIALWEDRASAERFFAPQGGVPSSAEFFEAPVILEVAPAH
ncbi:MAG: hypothetical protein AAF430_15130 [Myxococcota bacterium]